MESQVLKEIRYVLPKVCRLLGGLREQEVRVLYPDASYYPDNSKTDRDVSIAHEGAYEDMPFVWRRRLRTTEPATNTWYTSGLGLVLKESQHSGVRYVSYVTRIRDTEMRFYFVKSDEAGKLIRGWVRAKRKRHIVTPVLPQGVLDKAYRNTVGFLKKRRDMKKLGVKPTRGLILHGPPGNGKSMLTRWISDTAMVSGLTTAHVTASDFEEAFQKNMMAQLFSRAQVVTFDDIDISYFSRNKTGDSKKACSALAAMDGVGDQSTGVVRIFTTNESLDDIDEAFRRPGRIDLALSIPVPDRELRQRLVDSWPEEIAIDRQKTAKETDSFTFAELEFVRTTLVTNYLMDDVWDLDGALAEAKARNNPGGETERRIGF